MIIIDKALEQLEKTGKPIRVGLVGAGFAARGFALEFFPKREGMRLVAVANRTLENARKLVEDCGAGSGEVLVTDDYKKLCRDPQIDVIVEATGEVEFGTRVAMAAIENKKHLVLINAELDATLGPILKQKADAAGIVYTQGDGDQPAVLMNLYREVKGLGFRPVMVGNIKSLIDPRRTPETQKAFAEAHFQRPKHITSFADGTKISMEMATIANATGFPVMKRGMTGPRCARVEEAYKLFPQDKLLKTGLTDYILGAEPSFGVFVLGYTDNPMLQRYLKVYKMGEGTIYTFYRHCHLSPLEAPSSVARAVLFGDAALAPAGGPVCEVITLAKRDLKAGEILDGIGGFTCYGAIENYAVSRKENLLPMGLSDGCRLKRDLAMDAAITFDDIELPPDRLADRLYKEQLELFGS